MEAETNTIHSVRTGFGQKHQGADLCSNNIHPTYGVGGGFFALLMLPVVARHRAVRGLSLHGASIRTDQNTGHHAQRTVP